MDPTPENTSEPQTAPTDPAKSRWETILTMTPVVLTVLGTLLAGVSSSEMTLAQYYRSLASQNQSKAGDQWGFFQAKRIRGQGMETALDLLPATGRFAVIDPPALQEGADRLVRGLQRVEKIASQLQGSLAEAGDSLGGAGKPLRLATEGLSRSARQDAPAAEKARARLAQDLTKDEMKAAFACIGTGKLPEGREGAFGNPQIDTVLKAIADRLPDQQLNPLLVRLSEDEVARAIDTAEANARAFEVAGKPVSHTIETIDLAVDALIKPAAALHQHVRAVEAALLDVPAGDGKGLAEVRARGDALLRADAAVRSAAEDLNALSRTARLDYDSRRYRREAAYNQRIAGLYEIEVHQSSFRSDRHRSRSKLFFYGMLCAQAGVAIASLSLAARQRNVLWALAGLAGTTALVLSLYVYFYE